MHLYARFWPKRRNWRIKAEGGRCKREDVRCKREERIKNLSTDELIEEFKDKKSGNVSLIRNEMKCRYKENKYRGDG